MRRGALLLLLLLLSVRLAAASWEQVTLFDWVYPGEEAYQALKTGMQESGSQHWLRDRLARGEKVPQASARDLANELLEQPQVDQATKAVLKARLSSEPVQLGLGGAEGAIGRAEALSRQLDAAGQRMDTIEKIYKTNVYGKSSNPSLGMEVFSAYRGDVPGGFLQRRNRSFLLGGANYNFLSSLDKMTVGMGLGLRYWAGDSTQLTSSSELGQITVGASFQMPLDDGGIEVHLGDKQAVFMSPLLMGNKYQEGREVFFVEVPDVYRPPRVLKLLDLEYPALTREYHGLGIMRQGQTWYWPFSRTQFIYTPADNDYWQNWNTKTYTYALRLDRDISPNSWMDPGLYYVMFIKAETDKDVYRAVVTTVAQTKQSVEGFGAGFELRLLAGTQIKFDAAMSNYSRELVVNGPQRLDADFSAIGTLVQPIGPLNLAFEAGMAGPYFLSGPQDSGAVNNTMADVPWPAAVADKQSWINYTEDPALLTNNQTRMVLKAEWNMGWLGLGVYDGVLGQIKPSDARVQINPVLEGRSDNGYGWFRMFGQTYAAPAPAPAPLPVGASGVDAQNIFNRFTSSTVSGAPGARYGSGPGTINVNWQQISQQSYRAVAFNTLLTQDGIGDNRVMQPSQKTTNFLGARMIFDVGALFLRTLPSKLTFVGELRDLAAQPGLASVDGSNYFSQNFGYAVYEHGVSDLLTLVGRAGYETWKSKQSYFALDMQVQEYNGGFDLRLDPFITGLQLNVRGGSMQFDDLNRTGRAFSLWTLSVGSSLTY